MATIITDSNRDNHFSKDEILVRIESSLYDTPVNSFTTLKLASNPSDGYKWNIVFSKGSLTIYFVDTVTNPVSEVLIGANTAATHANAVALLNASYLIAKYFEVEYNAVSDRVEFRAKEPGSDYDLDLDSIEAGTTKTQEPGSGQVNNLQAGLIVFKKEGNDRTDVIAEYAAPVTNDSETVDFYIQDALHSQTSFVAPDEEADEPFLCDGHVIDYELAFFDISGSPPVQSLLGFSGTLRAVRGGSRFENDLAFGNTLMNYLISEQGGALLYSFIRRATLDQELYTYWYNSGSGSNVKVSVLVRYKDGDNVTGDLYNLTAVGKEVYGLPCGFGNCDIESIVTDDDHEMSDVDYAQFLLKDQFTSINIASLGKVFLEPSVFGERFFMFESSAGGCEVVRFTGGSNESIEITKEKYRQMGIPERYWERRKDGSRLIEYRERFNAKSGMLNKDEFELYLDILRSELCWEISYVDGERWPIEIEPGTFRVKEDNRDGAYFYYVEFAYSRSYEEQSMGLKNNYF